MRLLAMLLLLATPLLAQQTVTVTAPSGSSVTVGLVLIKDSVRIRDSVRVPADTLPAPSTGKGIPFGPYNPDASSAWTGGFLGLQPNEIIAGLAKARTQGRQILITTTPGQHSRYMKNGKFDLPMWKEWMKQYATPAIQAAVARAVSDGTLRGTSVMDEPMNTSKTNSWGPAGTVTLSMVDQMCGEIHRIFPTLPAGVVHDYDSFFPTQSYQLCDFIVSQYRWSKTKGDIQKFRDEGLAYVRTGHVPAIAWSLNILHGGFENVPGCASYGDDPRGVLCPMTPDQIKQWGLTLGATGCALVMWRSEPEIMNDPRYQAAFRVVTDSLGKLPTKRCTRA